MYPKKSNHDGRHQNSAQFLKGISLLKQKLLPRATHNNLELPVVNSNYHGGTYASSKGSSPHWGTQAC